MTSGNLYLVVAVIGALSTVNGYRPFARSGFVSLPACIAGVLTSELPLQIIAVQVLASAVFVAVGAVRSPAGVGGAALSVASWIGLVGLHRTAQRSRDVLEQSLRDGLGADYADRIRSRVPADDGRPLTLLEVLRPNRGLRKRYCNERDLAYGDAGVRNQLDIWRHPDLPLDARAPVLLQLHGGAWVMGRKDDQAGPLLTHLAERGWVCVSANYRLSPAATWPDQIVDVKQAIAWVRANIADHGGDPAFIAVTGGSAGGHLAALAALSPNDPGFQPGFTSSDTSVQAAVPLYGLYDLTNLRGGTRADTIKFLAKKVFKFDPDADPTAWAGASPICRVRSDSPPFFVVHGTNDSFLPVEQARAFAQDLREAVPLTTAFAELPRTQHAFDFFSSVRVHHTVRAIARFLTYAHETAATARREP